MTQRELIYVKTIADEKSISKAAKKLFIAQPSLSQFLKRIEESLGTSLFYRTASGLTLTYAGERYYHMAMQILRMYENFEMEISDINNMKTGRLQLGITNHLGTILLPKLLPRFATICPGIEIQITEENSTNLEQLLTAGKLDFAIMHAPAGEGNPLLQYDFLSRDPFILVMAKEHPLSCYKTPAKDIGCYPLFDISLLKKERFIMVPPIQRIRQVTDTILKKADITHPDIFLTVKNFSTAQLLASSGLGVTLVPKQYAEIVSANREPSYFEIPKCYDAYWELCIVTLTDSFLSKADLLFLQLLKELYPNALN